MVAVRGIYQGGDTVKLDCSSVPIHEPYEVVAAFLNPAGQPENSGKTADEKKCQKTRSISAFYAIPGNTARNVN